MRKHSPRGALGAAALVLVGALCGGVEAVSQPQVPILVLPLVVHTAEDPEYLRDGLGDMLASRLEQTGAFAVLRLPDARATTSLADALDAARSAGASFVLFGSFTRFGQGASLDMQCAATRGGDGEKPLRELFVHSGNIGDVIPDLDRLAGKVARFAVTDYEALELARQAAAAPAPSPEPEPSPELFELQARVAALEAALAGLGGDEEARTTAQAGE